MALRNHIVEFPPAQLAAQRRANAIMAHAPRLKTLPWVVETGQLVSRWLDVAAAHVTTPLLQRRGLTIEVIRTDGDCAVPLRILRPKGRPRAIILDIHGGGWVVGSATLNDRLNANLAHHGFCVVSVDYRLLSESKGVYIDSAIDDCVEAALWVATHVDQLGASDIFITGESAGGHLAALTTLALRDRGLIDLVKGCVLSYGVYDLSGTPSVRKAGPETLLFDGPNMGADLGRIAPGRDEDALRDPAVSPLYADLTGLPPVLFLAGLLDPLYEDSLRMSERWARVNDVDFIHVPETIHGFLHFGGPASRGARRAIRQWIASLLKSKISS